MTGPRAVNELGGTVIPGTVGRGTGTQLQVGLLVGEKINY